MPDGTDQSLPEDWCLETASGECLKLIENSPADQLEDHNPGDARTIDLRA